MPLLLQLRIFPYLDNFLSYTRYNPRSPQQWIFEPGIGGETFGCIVQPKTDYCMGRAHRKRLDSDVFVLYYPWEGNFQHFLMDTLPSIWWYFQLQEYHETEFKRPMNISVAIASNFLKIGKEILRYLGITQIVDLDTTISYSTVFIPSMTVFSGFPETNDRVTNVFSRLRYSLLQKLLPEGFPPQSKVIYIRRKDGKSGKTRIMVNELELFDSLQNLGFEEAVVSKMNISERFLYFSQAEYVVAETGAGISNYLFFPPNTTVIEIGHPRYDLRREEQLMNFFNISYFLIEGMGTVVDPVHNKGVNVPWSLDVVRATSRIKEIISADNVTY